MPGLNRRCRFSLLGMQTRCGLNRPGVETRFGLNQSWLCPVSFGASGAVAPRQSMPWNWSHFFIDFLHSVHVLTPTPLAGTVPAWFHGVYGTPYRNSPPFRAAFRRRSSGVPALPERFRRFLLERRFPIGCSSGRSGSVPAPFRTSRGHRRSRWMSCCAARIRRPLQLPWLDPHSLARWLIVLCHPGPDHRTIWSQP